MPAKVIFRGAAKLDDVVVVGAGPAGNNAALGLASRGFGVRVIDSRVNVGEKLCTGIIGTECARRFPLDPDLVYHEARSAQLVTPEKATLNFSAARPQASVVDRVSYVASFARRAEAAGETYHLGQRVLEINPEGSGVSIRTDQEHYRARAVIIASGFGMWAWAKWRIMLPRYRRKPPLATKIR